MLVIKEYVIYSIYFCSRVYMLKPKLENQELMYCCYAIGKAYYHYQDKFVPRNKKLKACNFREFATIIINVSGWANVKKK